METIIIELFGSFQVYNTNVDDFTNTSEEYLLESSKLELYTLNKKFSNRDHGFSFGGI